jgi:hypothetical protein
MALTPKWVWDFTGPAAVIFSVTARPTVFPQEGIMGLMPKVLPFNDSASRASETLVVESFRNLSRYFSVNSDNYPP